MISLFPHNEAAYHAAAAMLSEVGKAAIIHPTGTGKSFIAFKLCEDNPDTTICWLSPSEYIFKTQIENLHAVSGYKPTNIRFFTYAKLMNMSREDLAEIAPGYIVLDEFHRAGAEQWQIGVERLLDIYPNIPILGLSATNIRYLDNQRNMADELFDGNIASEMTLGEAIVRGILNPPKYVLSVYSYQNDLETYQRRARQAKNKVVRDAAEQLLEALRRALDKADGLDEIFDRHMSDRTGKYIVFCANYEHLCEMRQHTEWFQKVDPNPRVYTVYTEDPAASKSFQAFKKDTDTSHLRLLYAIDALNEGIHLDDISGVILLRPTVSPIIYKQQIGRALSAGKSREPVIFDIVNNIENLYSIDTLQAEMQQAVMYFRSIGEEQEIVTEQFRVWDEVRECKELFDRLNDTLSASWDLMYRHAEAFFQEHRHLDVPRHYKTEEGYSLGTWIITQRRVYSGEIAGRLTPQQVQRLNAISMCWDSRSESRWNRAYAELLRYKGEHGNLDIASDYMTADGFALGSLVSNIRTAKVYGQRSTYLTADHERQLTELGFIWDKLDYVWDQYYMACMQFKLEHGHLNIAAGYRSKEGLAIGEWVGRQRMIRAGRIQGRLTDTQIERLNAIGFIWESRYEQQWNAAYESLCSYRRIHGHVDIPVNFVDKGGIALGKWIRRQKENRNIRDERKAKLMALGVTFERTDPWDVRYAIAKQYYDEHGDLKVPGNYNVNGMHINKWLSEQRQIRLGKRKGKSLTNRQIDQLNAIGMVWERERARENESMDR